MTTSFFFIAALVVVLFSHLSWGFRFNRPNIVRVPPKVGSIASAQPLRSSSSGSHGSTLGQRVLKRPSRNVSRQRSGIGMTTSRTLLTPLFGWRIGGSRGPLTTTLTSTAEDDTATTSMTDVEALLEQSTLLQKKRVNGEFAATLLPQNLTAIMDTTDIPEDELLPLAPPLSFEKFLTMQDKRVVVTIRYSGESGLRPFFLTVAKKIKDVHPDVIVERRILPGTGKDQEANIVFEVLVDGKVVIGKLNRVARTRSSVFVSMQELGVAISRARRKRRPTTVYGDDEKEKAV